MANISPYSSAPPLADPFYSQQREAGLRESIQQLISHKMTPPLHAEKDWSNKTTEQLLNIYLENLPDEEAITQRTGTLLVRTATAGNVVCLRILLHREAHRFSDEDLEFSLKAAFEIAKSAECVDALLNQNVKPIPSNVLRSFLLLACQIDHRPYCHRVLDEGLNQISTDQLTSALKKCLNHQHTQLFREILFKVIHRIDHEVLLNVFNYIVRVCPRQLNDFLDIGLNSIRPNGIVQVLTGLTQERVMQTEATQVESFKLILRRTLHRLRNNHLIELIEQIAADSPFRNSLLEIAGDRIPIHILADHIQKDFFDMSAHGL